MERGYFTRRLPSFKLWNDSGNPPDLWTASSENDELNIDNNSWRAKGPSDFRNEGGILLGPAAPLPFIFLIADCSSLIRSGARLSSSADGTLIRFLNCRLVSRSDCDILSLLTLA